MSFSMRVAVATVLILATAVQFVAADDLELRVQANPLAGTDIELFGAVLVDSPPSDGIYDATWQVDGKFNAVTQSSASPCLGGFYTKAQMPTAQVGSTLCGMQKVSLSSSLLSVPPAEVSFLVRGSAQLTAFTVSPVSNDPNGYNAMASVTLEVPCFSVAPAHAIIDWGDNTPFSEGTAAGATVTLTRGHSYQTGTYTVTVKFSDDMGNGGTATRTFTIDTNDFPAATAAPQPVLTAVSVTSISVEGALTSDGNTFYIPFDEPVVVRVVMSNPSRRSISPQYNPGALAGSATAGAEFYDGTAATYFATFRVTDPAKAVQGANAFPVSMKFSNVLAADTVASATLVVVKRMCITNAVPFSNDLTAVGRVDLTIDNPSKLSFVPTVSWSDEQGASLPVTFPALSGSSFVASHVYADPAFSTNIGVKLVDQFGRRVSVVFVHNALVAAPTVSLSVAAGSTFKSGVPITIRGDITNDAGGVTTSVRFSFGDNTADVTDSSEPYSTVHQFGIPATYFVVASALDKDGMVIASDTHPVIISGDATQPPSNEPCPNCSGNVEVFSVCAYGNVHKVTTQPSSKCAALKFNVGDC